MAPRRRDTEHRQSQNSKNTIKVKQPALPSPGGCKTFKKTTHPKQGPNTKPHTQLEQQSTINEQNRTTALEKTADEAWPGGYKTFFMLNLTEHEISTAHKN